MRCPGNSSIARTQGIIPSRLHQERSSVDLHMQRIVPAAAPAGGRRGSGGRWAQLRLDHTAPMLWGGRRAPPAPQAPSQSSELQWWAAPLPAPRLPVAHGARHLLVSRSGRLTGLCNAGAAPLTPSPPPLRTRPSPPSPPVPSSRRPARTRCWRAAPAVSGGHLVWVRRLGPGERSAEGQTNCAPFSTLRFTGPALPPALPGIPAGWPAACKRRASAPRPPCSGCWAWCKVRT